MIYEIVEKSADIVGIAGVILLLIAYYFLNTNKLSADGLNYQLLNFIGASFILFSLFFDWNTASVLIESAWIIISLIGIYRILRARN